MDEHLAMLGHDLRSELSTIMGISELIELASTDRNEIREFARIIQNHNQYMLDLVNGLVVSAKAGGIQPRLVPVDTARLALAVIQGIAANPRRTPVALAIVGSIPVHIHSDALLLRQILTNLVGNAVRYTKEGGVRLLLAYAEAANRLRLTITDTGPGMDESAISRSAEPDRGIHGTEPGTGRHGLGLWIARRLTALLQGEIAIQSLPGHGTAVTVSLPAGDVSQEPRIDDDAFRAAARLDSGPGRAQIGALTGLRILVADDTPSNRLFAATLLKRCGASVSLAEDGLVALEVWRKAAEGGRPFDAIIFDQTMPRLTGTQAAETLRQEGVRVPILVWSADEHIADHLPPCFTAFIAKPAEAAVFQGALIQVLGQRAAEA